MTRKELEKTPWAKKFKSECPSSYEEAIERALSPNFEVIIIHSHELEKRIYAIEALEEGEKTEFWMEAFEYKGDAIALCERMGWRIVE